MTDPESEPTNDEALLVVPSPMEGDQGRWTIRPEGEIDMSNAPVLAAAFAEAVDRHAATLVVDLAEVTYLDSSGIGVLIEALHSIEADGGALRVVGASGIVARVLELSGLLPLLDGQSD
jgi:anti-anti-sigma factor